MKEKEKDYNYSRLENRRIRKGQSGEEGLEKVKIFKNRMNNLICKEDYRGKVIVYLVLKGLSMYGVYKEVDVLKIDKFFLVVFNNLRVVID